MCKSGGGLLWAKISRFINRWELFVGGGLLWAKNSSLTNRCELFVRGGLFWAKISRFTNRWELFVGGGSCELKSRVLQIAGNSLSRWNTLSFSRNTVLRGVSWLITHFLINYLLQNFVTKRLVFRFHFLNTFFCHLSFRIQDLLLAIY